MVRYWRFRRQKKGRKTKGVLDEPTLRKLENKKLKPGVSKTKLSKEITDKGHQISKSSVSRGFSELGLKALKKSKEAKLTPKQVKARYECSKIFKDKPPEFWERFLITYEKIWTTNPSLVSDSTDVIFYLWQKSLFLRREEGFLKNKKPSTYRKFALVAFVKVDLYFKKTKKWRFFNNKKRNKNQ